MSATQPVRFALAGLAAVASPPAQGTQAAPPVSGGQTPATPQDGRLPDGQGPADGTPDGPGAAGASS